MNNTISYYRDNKITTRFTQPKTLGPVECNNEYTECMGCKNKICTNHLYIIYVDNSITLEPPQKYCNECNSARLLLKAITK